MTVSSTARVKRFDGNDATTEFDFSFKTFDRADLQVVLTDSAGDETTLTIDSHYSVSLNFDQDSSPGGTVTYPLTGSPLATGKKLTVVSAQDTTQGLSINNAGGFHASTIESAFDKLTIGVQQNAEKIARALLASPSDDEPGLTLATAAERANTFPSFDNNGNLEFAQTLPSGTLSRSSIGGFLYPKTDAEIAAGVEPDDIGIIPGNVKRYGAVGDGATDDTAAFEAAHSVMLQEAGTFVVPPGVYLIKDFVWTADDCTILCYGILRHANTDAGFVIKLGDSSGTSVNNLQGNLRLDSNITEAGFANTVSGVRIAALVNAHLHIDAKGFTYGVDVETEDSVVYNKLFLGTMQDNNRAVYIHPGAAGFCNRNDWYGGRFSLQSGLAFNNHWSIYIEDSGLSVPNDNNFYSPSFEGKAGAWHDEGGMNHVHDCRFEVTTSGTPGTDFADPYIDFQGGGYSSFKAAYTLQMKDVVKDVGAATRDHDNRFTLAAADHRDYLFPGARVYVTVSAVTHECTVVDNTLSGGDTVVRVAEPVITDNPTAVEPLLINAASTAEASFFFPNDDIAGESDAETASINRLILAMIRCAVVLSSFDETRPALTLMAGGSSANTLIKTLNVDGSPGMNMNGNGNAYFPRLAVGNETTPAPSQSHIANASESHTLNATYSNVEVQNALDALGDRINSLIAVVEAFGFTATS